MGSVRFFVVFCPSADSQQNKLAKTIAVTNKGDSAEFFPRHRTNRLDKTLFMIRGPYYARGVRRRKGANEYRQIQCGDWTNLFRKLPFIRKQSVCHLANGAEVLFLEACVAGNAHEANWVPKQVRSNENFTAWENHLVCDDCSQQRHFFFWEPLLIQFSTMLAALVSNKNTMLAASTAINRGTLLYPWATCALRPYNEQTIFTRLSLASILWLQDSACDLLDSLTSIAADQQGS